MKTCEIEINSVSYIASKNEWNCNGCSGRADYELCDSFCKIIDCGNKGIIWIKKEDSVKATEEITFSPEQTSSSENIAFSSSQIKYLSEVFGIDASEEVLKVSDGFVKKSGTVWRVIPKQCQAIDYWDNIKDNPEAYSVKEPKFKV